MKEIEELLKVFRAEVKKRDKMESNDKRESEIEEEMKKVEIIENKMKEMDELLKNSVYHIEEVERIKNMKNNDKKESKKQEEMIVSMMMISNFVLNMLIKVRNVVLVLSK